MTQVELRIARIFVLWSLIVVIGFFLSFGLSPSDMTGGGFEILARMFLTVILAVPVSVYLAVITGRAKSELSGGYRFFGYSPAILMTVFFVPLALFYFWPIIAYILHLD